jgi:ubiquinone/menaquinone biosynthesis C-methylase UbiE
MTVVAADDDLTQPPEVLAYYARGVEAPRLSRGHGLLEEARTREIVSRHLLPRPQVIVDVGGGPGSYACWLAGLGHAVHLLDASPLHVEQAREASARHQARLKSVRLGDARRLPQADSCADAVLLLGPLYHLTERTDRLAALAEARRVLKSGGLLFAAAISRFASLLDGLVSGYLGDSEYVRIVENDLRTGQHRNPTSREYFTTAFFHLPEELEREVTEAGLVVEELLGVEGPGWLLSDLEARWKDPEQRRQLLEAARAVERAPSLLGLSPHLLAVARKG